jgi:hypothetical protein
MKLFDVLGVSQESIDFQSGLFGKELEFAFSTIRVRYKEAKDTYDCPEKRLIENAVKKHTGLNITINFNTSVEAATSVPDLSNSTILRHNHIREYLRSNDALICLKAAKQDKEANLVDIKRARVSGQFAELNNIVFIAAELFLKDTLTIQEYVGIFLHEIGHIFVCFEYLNRTITTNQVMASVMKAVMEKSSIKEREIIFKEASEILNVKDRQILELENITDVRVVSTVILKCSVENIKSELEMPEYDFTSFEMLADQFSTRQGYGRHLITGLDKLMHGSPQRTRSSTFLCFLFETFITFMKSAKWYLTFIAIVTGSVAVGLLPFVILEFLLLSIGIISMVKISGSKNKNYTYDNLKTRYLRVREQMIQRLKDKRISPHESKELIESIKVIDQAVEQTIHYIGPLDLISNFIFSSDSNVRDFIVLQRKLEELASNDLFLKSAELSLLKGT